MENLLRLTGEMLTKEDIRNTIDSVNYNISGVQMLLDQKSNLESNLSEYTDKLKEAEDRIQFLSNTKGFYVKAVDLMYEESIGALKETLNTALQYIIYDKRYSCNLTLEDKRGQKYLYTSLVDIDEDTEVDMKHGVGQGVRSVISAILKTFYLLNQGSNILLVDEKYSALSDQYIPRFFEFLKKLCEDKDKQMIIVAVTHDERFFVYADKCYLVNDGHVTELAKGDEVVLEKEENR